MELLMRRATWLFGTLSLSAQENVHDLSTKLTITRWRCSEATMRRHRGGRYGHIIGLGLVTNPFNTGFFQLGQKSKVIKASTVCLVRISV
ncbi:hypothetical protein SDJN03_16903, partial [Cucurbita argyrosperma subsp. sororia]